MWVAGVRVGSTVQRAAGPGVGLGVPSPSQDEGNSCYHADHQNDACYANADREVPLRYADFVFFL